MGLLHNECIPLTIRKPFRKMCELAYTSLFKFKRLFAVKDIEQADIKDTLGILNTRPTITMSGSRQYHSFYHDTVQEFLAAVHLSTIEESEQVTAVKWFLGNNLVRSQVLPFYAGLTNLSSVMVFKVLSKSLPLTGNSEAIPVKMRKNINPKQQTLAFLKCLYECQNESLLQLPETDLPINECLTKAMKQYNYHDRFEDVTTIKALSFSGLHLTPLECLSVGYYIRVKHLRAIPELTNPTLLSCDFAFCQIREVGIYLFLTELAKNVTDFSHTTLRLILCGNQFDKRSLLSLKNLLQKPIRIKYLLLSHFLDPAVVDPGFVLKCVIEGLANNSVCHDVALYSHHFNSSHIYHIILLLLTCSGIENLSFLFKCILNSIVMPLFSRAVALSSLRQINLSACNISDSDLDILGENLQGNCHMKTITLTDNKFTHAGFCKFLRRLKTNYCSQITKLYVPACFEEHYSVKLILKEINDFRSMLPHPRPGNLVVNI